MAQGFTPYSGGSFGGPPGGSTGPGPGGQFSAAPTPSRSTKASSEPVLHLLPSLLLGLVGIGLNVMLTFGGFVATDSAWALWSFLAWFLAGVLGISLLGWYFTEVNRRKGAGFFTRVGWKRVVAVLTFAVLAVAVLWSAIDIAQWAGKL
ncbi:hypothetical protein EAH68_03065 [Corynebacterium hylobatis]|uniref:Uncharacterized protein n=1 Tax=Corynebacterium hylobatis TaxID=1859290 RepID=A0A3R9ZEY4_9CORY|nr:hypothetical protein [Corynebacterium hylobatis]RSZ65136.1 hypothetical protein EAH68_03065 [Corynebacterium hylobatis]